MKQETWELREKYWEQREGHPDRYWGFDQLRHNAMFWSQDIPFDDRFQSHMNYMCHRVRGFDPVALAWANEWNRCPLQNAHILHFCASRGSSDVINMMKFLCDNLGISYE